MVEDALELGDRGGDISKEHDMIHDFTDGHTRIFNEYQIGRQYDDEYGTSLSDETFPSVEIEGSLANEHLIVCKLCLQLPLFLAFDLFPVEGLDDIDAFNNVHHSVTFLFPIMSHVSSPTL